MRTVTTTSQVTNNNDDSLILKLKDGTDDGGIAADIFGEDDVIKVKMKL